MSAIGRKQTVLEMRRILTLAGVVVLSAACDGSAPAGGAMDSKATVQEAESYQTYVAANVTEEMMGHCPGQVTQQFQQMFRRFEQNYPDLREEPTTVRLGTATAAYRDRHFIFQLNGKPQIDEWLPSAFYMHTAAMGIHEINGRPIIMVTVKARASTGLYFIGIYDANGTPYYKRVLTTGDVWDLEPSSTHIDILGACQTRRIRFGRN